MTSDNYEPKNIERKWQNLWETQKVFKAVNPSDDEKKRPKFYSLCMFPYPSGSIHMGHLRNYAIGDVIARFKRMKGFNVLQPIGWDAFGLPAENAANQRGVHPKKWTLENIAQMRTEFKAMGMAYDWDREITTCLPDYFKWEQLFFKHFYERGLAYKKQGTVNFCERCETVLANEQVVEGRCWRCDQVVHQKTLSQWYYRITDFSESLLNDHQELRGHWPDRVLEMQKHWIGKSEGAQIDFEIVGSSEKIRVFTTRPDTIFGVSFVTIAPLHPMAKTLCKTKEKADELKKIIEFSSTKARDDLSKQGFFTGSFARHPLTQKEIPIWVGDFVVMEYGTGAVMGVPAHDERDFEFAKQYQLPIRAVILPIGQSESVLPYTEPGVLTESAEFSGVASEAAKARITSHLEAKKAGKKTVQYRLKDWGISRQRYWGAPIPVVYCKDCGVVLVPDEELPVTLPEDVEFRSGGGNPLARHPSFKTTSCPKCKGPAERETDTMDTFVESSWYYARYTDAKNTNKAFDRAIADQWLPVDIYIGGVEHACMHLLYSRFFHKVLRDEGMVSSNEPFANLQCQGMVIKDGAKMSKSKGNVVSLEAFLEKYGADTGRLFSLFAAPPEKDLDWNEKGVEGSFRFLSRLWRLFIHHSDLFKNKAPGGPVENEVLLKLMRKAHLSIQKIGQDIEAHKFNTAVAAAMEWINEIYGLLDEHKDLLQTEQGHYVFTENVKQLVLCLAPFTPHICEELWSLMGEKDLVCDQRFPEADPKYLIQESFLCIVQINGKVRDRIELKKNLSKEDVEKEVLGMAKVQAMIQGKSIRQLVYVPGRLVNIVAS